MPAGRSARISARLALQGRMELNTCCSRIRRAINCVYCPPKSSTTTPPNSDFGFVLTVCILASVVIGLLGDHQVQQLVRNIDYLDDALSLEVRGDARVGGGAL